MSGMWNRTLVYLGLREEPEDVYDEHPEQFVPEHDPHAQHAPARPAAGTERELGPDVGASSRPAPGEVRAARLAWNASQEPADSNVRPLRGTDAEPTPAPATTRTSVIGITAFDDVEGIGARHRTGQPVVFDLSGADAATARRVVDFVSGVAYALRGDMVKVGSRAFLLTPHGVSLSADERRRLVDMGFRIPTGSGA